MAKATITLTNGTEVVIEGSPEEVQQLLEFYSGEPIASGSRSKKVAGKKTNTKKTTAKKRQTKGADTPTVDHAEIVNLVKTCDEAEKIEENILDRTAVVDRTLLPLYIVHEYLGNALALTSGDVNKITTDLGIPVRTPHASTALSKTASKYVIGDQVRKKGRTIRYKLSRRGVQYMKSVVNGKNDEE